MVLEGRAQTISGMTWMVSEGTKHTISGVNRQVVDFRRAETIRGVTWMTFEVLEPTICRVTRMVLEGREYFISAILKRMGEECKSVFLRFVGNWLSIDDLIPMYDPIHVIHSVPAYDWIPLSHWIPMYHWVSAYDWIPLSHWIPMYHWVPASHWIPMYHLVSVYLHWIPAYDWSPLCNWLPLYVVSISIRLREIRHRYSHSISKAGELKVLDLIFFLAIFLFKFRSLFTLQ